MTMTSTAQLRKIKKPVIERRRRERINECLQQLKTIILEAENKEPSRYSKMEKADILEMTVKHLRAMYPHELSPPSNSVCSPPSSPVPLTQQHFRIRGRSSPGVKRPADSQCKLSPIAPTGSYRRGESTIDRCSPTTTNSENPPPLKRFNDGGYCEMEACDRYPSSTSFPVLVREQEQDLPPQDNAPRLSPKHNANSRVTTTSTPPKSQQNTTATSAASTSPTTVLKLVQHHLGGFPQIQLTSSADFSSAGGGGLLIPNIFTTGNPFTMQAPVVSGALQFAVPQPITCTSPVVFPSSSTSASVDNRSCILPLSAVAPVSLQYTTPAIDRNTTMGLTLGTAATVATHSAGSGVGSQRATLYTVVSREDGMPHANECLLGDLAIPTSRQAAIPLYAPCAPPASPPTSCLLTVTPSPSSAASNLSNSKDFKTTVSKNRRGSNKSSSVQQSRIDVVSAGPCRYRECTRINDDVSLSLSYNENVDINNNNNNNNDNNIIDFCKGNNPKCLRRVDGGSVCELAQRTKHDVIPMSPSSFISHPIGGGDSKIATESDMWRPWNRQQQKEPI